MLATVRGLFPELTTARAQQSRVHAIRAMGVLRDGPVSWFWPGESAIMAGGAKASFSILEALGRLEDEDAIRSVAAALAEAGSMTAGEAVRRIRRARRVNRALPGAVEDAVAVILRAVNGYLATHPDAWDEVIRALDVVRMATASERPAVRDKE